MTHMHSRTCCVRQQQQFSKHATHQQERSPPRVQHSVPMDDTQPNCAITGEPFETTWDTKTQQWHYVNAKRVTADEAARYVWSCVARAGCPCTCVALQRAMTQVWHSSQFDCAGKCTGRNAAAGGVARHAPPRSQAGGVSH